MSEQLEQALSDAQSALELSSRVPNQAINLAMDAMNSAGGRDSIVAAYALAAVGSAYSVLENFQAAERVLSEAINSAYSQRLPYVMARIHQSRGWIAHCQGKPVDAFFDWQSALALFRQIRNTEGTAWVLNHYAESYTQLGLLDRAIQCRVSALDLVQGTGSDGAGVQIKLDLAGDYVRRGWHEQELHRPGHAKVQAQIATALALEVLGALPPETAHPRQLEAVYRIMGEALLLQDRPSEALQSLELAHGYAVRSGEYRTETRIASCIGLANYLQGLGDHAIAELLAAIESAPSETPIGDLRCAHAWLSMCYETAGEPQLALESLRASIDVGNRSQKALSDFWATMHDATIGLNESLRDPGEVLHRESNWTYTERELQAFVEGVSQAQQIDPLTGVSTRRTIQRRIHQWNESGESPFAVMFEIENLNEINHRFERRIGDEVLRSVGTIIAATVESQAEIARYSGNEFLVVAPRPLPQSLLGQVIRASGTYPWIAIDPDLRVNLSHRVVQAMRPNLLAA